MHPTAVELNARAGGGLEVSLLWNRASGRTWVDVKHVRSGEHFTVEAPASEALEVFNHPFSYAAQASADG